ncbi:acyltransferase family protein [Pseudoalteromonas sp. S16_S37]|uniref:acyltransferase family protein n=1 Tax=Pseudoalteromonas sp. S16_S37 TaxID=2720228 RepID=UPI00168129C0|nr:acyltransferase family protein [Pseudoalteromonas sp. S16_S37]MBD1581119.1 acyltransferase family protein [Pseudoalteromonas sp. S16_S37]
MNQRRYDIDALRVLAFAVLILYHIGMYYVANWGWHIKSATTYEWLQDVMILTNPWRMSLLFFISGVALANALANALNSHKYSVVKLIALKSRRLFIPLLFGMFVIVSPQVYFEALSQNLIEPGFWQFWLAYINPATTLLREHHSAIGLLTWNHLWFLPYLWVYSIIALLFKQPLILFANTRRLKQVPLAVMVLFCVAALIAIWWALSASYPKTHDLINDWYNHGKYFFVFLTGFVFAIQHNWWQSVIKHRVIMLAMALCCYAFIIADRHGVWATLASLYQTNLSVKLLYAMIHGANHWLWMFTVVGFAGYYLNRKNTLINYANRAVLPYYILHQTLIIVFAWWLKGLVIHPTIESLILLLLTVAGCYLGYELIKRSVVLSMLFGVTKKVPKSAIEQPPHLASPN